MTTGWLLLLLLVVSSQGVDSQSTTNNRTSSDGGSLSKLEQLFQLQRSDMERVLVNQQQLFRQHQTVLDNQQQIFQILQQHQAVLSRLGKSLFPMSFAWVLFFFTYNAIRWRGQYSGRSKKWIPVFFLFSAITSVNVYTNFNHFRCYNKKCVMIEMKLRILRYCLMTFTAHVN